MSRADLFGRRRRRRAKIALAAVLGAVAITGGGALAFMASNAPPAGDDDPGALATSPAAEPTEDAGGEPDGGATDDATPRAADTPAPEPATEPTPDPDPLPPPPDLVEDLEDLVFDEAAAEVDRLSVRVVDEAGTVLVDHQGDAAVMPASTNKLVTAAAALHLLGPEYRYVTRAVATGPVDDGVIDGDLVVVGEGDPALASPSYVEEIYPARPHTPMRALADAIVDAGVDEITGSVLGDPGSFADEPVAAGWRDRYFDTLDATHASGLTVDGGRRLIERNDTLLGMVAEDPTVVTAEVLHDLLLEADVEIGSDPGRGTAPPQAVETARVQSPPLIDLLSHVVLRSDNHMADAVFRTLGARAGDGTWSGGDVTARASLADLQVDWAEATIADGSGLSRDNRLSAEMLTELDRSLSQQYGELWRDLMAVMGESGTLSRRLRGTPAEGRVTGKTGSLRDSRALVGRAEPDDGGPYHFAVLGAELEGAEIAVVRDLINDVALRLAEG